MDRNDIRGGQRGCRELVGWVRCDVIRSVSVTVWVMDIMQRAAGGI